MLTCVKYFFWLRYVVNIVMKIAVHTPPSNLGDSKRDGIARRSQNRGVHMALPVWAEQRHYFKLQRVCSQCYTAY